MTDADALAQFEAVVLTQQPATAPWQPVTDYSFDARQAIEGEHPDRIVQAFAPLRVLDVGCGPGHLVRLLRDRGLDATGVDLPRFDVTSERLGMRGLFDLVICREVLEHLTIQQIRKAVTNLCHLTSRFVYVTTRFHLAPEHLLDVMTADDLDPTHISMLNQTFLRALFVLEGFRRRADLEDMLDWQSKGRVLVYERA